MSVRLVDETESQELARLVLQSVEPSPEEREVTSPSKERPPGRQELIEVMGVLARILGFRVQLFAAFLGALGLGGYAVYQANTMALTAAGMFNLMVFAPLCWIAFKRG